MSDTAQLATIRIHKKEGRCYLDMMEWPEHAEFSVGHVLRRPECVRLNKGHIDLRFENARAVYRIDDTNLWLDTYITTLVYAEGPDA